MYVIAVTVPLTLVYFARSVHSYVQLLLALSVAVFFGSNDAPSFSSSTVTLSGWNSVSEAHALMTVMSTVSGVFETVIVPFSPDTLAGE